MDQIIKCNNTDCNQHKYCKRFLIAPVFGQEYEDFKPNKNGYCDVFIPSTGRELKDAGLIEDHDFYDSDIEKIINHADHGNPELRELVFKEPIEAVVFNKSDVVALAKLFNFSVCENNG